MTLLPFLIVIGILAGALAGLFGVGGGIVTVPALHWLLSVHGYDDVAMNIALATSLAIIIPTSAMSLSGHHANGNVDWKILRGWSLPVGLGAVCGQLTARHLSTDVLQTLFACLATFAAIQFLLGRPDWKIACNLPKRSVKWGLGSGLGYLSALLGIGGGILGVTLLLLFGQTTRKSVGTAAGFGVVIGLPGAIAATLAGQTVSTLPPGSLGFVNIPAFFLIALGAIFTARLSSRLSRHLNVQLLKQLFAGLLLFVALRMAL